MLPRKMKVPGSNPSVLMGSNSLIAVFAGVLAVVGVSTLHKRKMRQMISHAKPATRSNQVQVGLLKLHAPRNFR
jgi:hypothetical protein